MFFFLGRCGPYLHVLIPLACQGNELHLLLARYVFAQLWATLSFKPTISPLPHWIPAYSAHGGECKVDVCLPLFTFVLPYLVFTRDINIRHSSVAPESGLTNLISFYALPCSREYTLNK